MHSSLDVKGIKRAVTPVFKRSGIRRSELFGSFARGEATLSSDVDFLVEYAPETSLLDVIQLRDDLQQVLGRKVDLVSYRAISPRLRPHIMKDVVKIL